MIDAKTVGYKQTEAGEPVRLNKIIESLNAGMAPLPPIVPDQIAEIMGRTIYIASAFMAIQANLIVTLQAFRDQIGLISATLEIGNPESESTQLYINSLSNLLADVANANGIPFETGAAS